MESRLITKICFTVTVKSRPAVLKYEKANYQKKVSLFFVNLEQEGALDLGGLKTVVFAYGLTGHNKIKGNVDNP